MKKKKYEKKKRKAIVKSLRALADDVEKQRIRIEKLEYQFQSSPMPEDTGVTWHKLTGFVDFHILFYDGRILE